MTRELTPRFDLYGELEVSSQASVEVIEAAYRRLAKQHHPDVSTSSDAQRITRLNLAREWLVDPVRRYRYDTSRKPRDEAASGGLDVGDAPSQTFGPNATEVRQFLADLRSLDRYRARQVWDGRAVAHAKGYTRARRAAAATPRGHRHDEWLFAREAATVIARGKLGDGPLIALILDVLEDTAGFLAIRDLLPRKDLQILLLPWTWRGEPVEPRASAAPFVEWPGGPKDASKPLAVEAPELPPVLVSHIPPSLVPPMASAITRAHVSAEAAAEASAAPAALSAATPNSPIPSTPATTPAPPWPAADLAPAAPIGATAAAAMATAATAGVASAALHRTDARAPIGDLGVSPWANKDEARTRRAPAPPGQLQRARPTPPGVRTRPAFPWTLAMLAVVAMILVGGIIGALSRSPSELAVAGETDVPATVGPPSTGEGSLPGATVDPTASGPVLVDPTLVPVPGATPDPTERSNRTPPPGATPKPPKPTPITPPTPIPVPPTPTPVPPTPPPVNCTVPNLFNVNSSNAQLAWDTAGFSGTVVFNPAPPPQYKIKWQSLDAGTSALCTSGVTVMNAAP